MVKASDYPIRHGGLFRCCIKTITDTELDAEPEEEHILKCNECSALIVLHKGFWQWCDSAMIPASP